MSYNGLGIFVVNSAGQPVVAGTTITSTAFNALTADLATGLSTAICKDGQTITSAVIPFALGLSSASLVDLSGALAGQIKFPATQNASANPNTLDDYQELTWVPSITFGGSFTGGTATAFGYQTKIGNVIRWQCEIQLVAKGSSTGNALVSGLPEASANINGNRSPASVLIDVCAGITVPCGYVGPNSQVIVLNNFVSNAVATMTDANFTDTTNLIMSGTYQTA